VEERIVEFLRMGGYAAFVWPAYAVTAAGMAGLLWHSLRAYRRARRAVAALQARRPGRADRA